MAANINDKFLKVGTEGTLTSLEAPGKALGASSITVGATANWPTDTAVSFSIRQYEMVDGVKTTVDGTYTSWKGVVGSGTTITNLVLKSGVDQVYSADGVTEVFINVTSEQHNSMVDGILTEHNQDGSHNATKVAMLAGAQTITGIKTFSTTPVVPDNSWTGAKIAPATIKSSNIDWTTLGTSVGSLNVSTTGNKSITTLPFTPRVVLFFPMMTSTAAAGISMGVMTSSYNASVATSGSLGAVNRSSSSIVPLYFTSTSGSVVFSMSYVSVNSNGFTVDVTMADSTIPSVTWIAFP